MTLPGGRYEEDFTYTLEEIVRLNGNSRASQEEFDIREIPDSYLYQSVLISEQAEPTAGKTPEF